MKDEIPTRWLQMSFLSKSHLWNLWTAVELAIKQKFLIYLAIARIRRRNLANDIGRYPKACLTFLHKAYTLQMIRVSDDCNLRWNITWVKNVISADLTIFLAVHQEKLTHNSLHSEICDFKSENHESNLDWLNVQMAQQYT